MLGSKLYGYFFCLSEVYRYLGVFELKLFNLLAETNVVSIESQNLAIEPRNSALGFLEELFNLGGVVLAAKQVTLQR